MTKAGKIKEVRNGEMKLGEGRLSERKPGESFLYPDIFAAFLYLLSKKICAVSEIVRLGTKIICLLARYCRLFNTSDILIILWLYPLSANHVRDKIHPSIILCFLRLWPHSNIPPGLYCAHQNKQFFSLFGRSQNEWMGDLNRACVKVSNGGREWVTPNFIGGSMPQTNF